MARRALVLSSAAALLVAACSGPTDPSGSDPAEQPPAQDSPAGESAGGPAGTAVGADQHADKEQDADDQQAKGGGSGKSADGDSATEVRDSSLDLPLIQAAAGGQRDQVRRLLKQGASVRATDSEGRTPLVAAAYGNHTGTAQLLLESGADPNEKDVTVQSPYLIATSEVGDDPALLNAMLQHGADVDLRDSFNGTGLIRAADRGFPNVVQRLLRTDIQVDHVNRLGWTALHEAIILGDGSQRYVRVVQLLVDAGADVNLPSAQDGVLPLAHAEQQGYLQIADVLRAAGAHT